MTIITSLPAAEAIHDSLVERVATLELDLAELTDSVGVSPRRITALAQRLMEVIDLHDKACELVSLLTTEGGAK